MARQARAAAAVAALALSPLLAAGAASAQQTDSIARRDSALAERERGRIRGERVRTTTPRRVDSSSAAPRSRRPSWRGELGLAFGARYMESDGGVEVQSRVLPFVGGGAAWTTGARTMVGLAARLSAGGLLVSNAETDWDAGSVLLGDLMGTVEWAVHPRATLHGGLGLTWVRGPSDVAPFRFNNDAPLHAGAVVGASTRLPGSRPLRAFLDVHGIRYGGGTADDPIADGGTVTRYVLGVRYGK